MTTHLTRFAFAVTMLTVGGLLAMTAMAAGSGSVAPTVRDGSSPDTKDAAYLAHLDGRSRGSAQGEKQTCTLATLKGRYLFATSGTILPPAFGVTEPTPGASAGFHIFNGDGTGTDIVTVRIGGEIALRNVAAPISYTVNADCTGSYTPLVPDGPSFDLFIAPDGDAVATIATAPQGNYVSSIDERVSRK